VTGTRGRVNGDGDSGTLGGVRKLKRTVEVVRQACHGVLRQWRLGLVSRAVERCLRHKCWKLVVGVLRRGLRAVWSRRYPRLRLRGSHPCVKMGVPLARQWSY
jgi:hypothetical protein